MERETKTITIEEIEIVYKPWITGAEYMRITSMLSNGQKISSAGEAILSESLIEKSEKEMFKAVIVSVGGETEFEKAWEKATGMKSVNWIKLDGIINKAFKGIETEDEKK